MTPVIETGRRNAWRTLSEVPKDGEWLPALGRTLPAITERISLFPHSVKSIIDARPKDKKPPKRALNSDNFIRASRLMSGGEIKTMEAINRMADEPE